MSLATMPTTKSRLFLLCCTLIFFKDAKTTKVDHCILGNGTLPSKVELIDCEVPPCTFYVNAYSSMTMKFRSPRYLEHFAPRAVAFALGATVPYPLGQDDGCVGVTNTPCPLAENEYIEYTYSMFIYPIFPKISFTLEFSLVDLDQNEEQLECFRVNLNLKDLPIGNTDQES